MDLPLQRIRPSSSRKRFSCCIMVVLLLDEDLELRSDIVVLYTSCWHCFTHFISAQSSSADVRGPKNLSRGCFRQLLINRDM